MSRTVRARRFDANQRPRGQCLIGLEWRGRTIVAVTHQERHYLPTGRTATRPTGESVIEMMARDYLRRSCGSRLTTMPCGSSNRWRFNHTTI